MQFRSLAAGIAIVLLATLVAPVHVAAAPQAPSPGILLSPTAPFMVAEGSAARTYDVKLSTPPVADVTVAITGMAGELSVSPATPLKFNATNWDRFQTVTVGAVRANDAVLQGTHTLALLHTATSSDPNYGGSPATGAPKTASLTVYLADNDLGLAVAQTGGSTSVNENLLANDTVEVSLGAAPTATVLVDLRTSDPTQLQLSRFNGLQFTTGNWFVPQAVTVFAKTDDVAEGNLAYAITGSTRTGGGYTNVASAPVQATVVDDDVAGLRLLNAAGSAALSGSPPAINSAPAAGEANSATYSVALSSQPLGTVTVTLSTDASQVTLSKSSLAFGPGNWTVAQPVTVTAKQDSVDEGSDTVAQVVSVVHDVASAADATYNALADRSAAFSYLDNDVAGYRFNDGATINATASPIATVAEANPAATGSYKVKLSSQPVAPVTVSFAGASRFTVSPASHTFTTSDWDQNVTVTVTAVNDNVAQGQQDLTLAQAVSSTDPRYQGIPSVTVRVLDNDTAQLKTNLTVTTPIQIQENGSMTFKLRLGSQPTSGVDVDPTSGGQLSTSPDHVLFTTSNWNDWQTVTVLATDNDVSEATASDTVTLTPTSQDANYNGASKAIHFDFTVIDDDGVVVIDETGGLTEVGESSGSDTYLVRLASPPDKDVRVTVTAPAGLKVNGQDSVTLLFNASIPDESVTLVDTIDQLLEFLDLGVLDLPVVGPLDLTHLDLGAAYGRVGSNWNQGQAVTVTSTGDDGLVSGPRALAITHRVASADPAFDAGSGALARPVIVRFLDDDPGVLVEETGAGTAVTEGATDTYTVRLSTQPTESFVILVHTDAQVSVDQSTLFFDPFAWEEPQTVTVTGVRDHIAEQHTMASAIRHEVSANNAPYAGMAVRDVTVTVTDTDSPGATPSKASVAVTEGGATDTYTLVLDSQPPSTVTISLAASNGQVTVSPASVSISPATWNQPRTITVTAVNDNVAEGAQSATIHHTMAGPTGWSGLPVADVSVAITDNDAPGLVITSTGGAPDRVTEGGAGDGFNVRLASQPTSTVKVSVTTTDAKLNVVYTELTFLPDSTDWNTVHLAWFTAPDDAIASGTRDATITFTVTSGDANYVALAPVQKTMNVVDND